MTIKNYRPGLSPETDPKKKLALGVLALACVFGIGFVLDFASSASIRPQEEKPPASQVVDDSDDEKDKDAKGEKDEAAEGVDGRNEGKADDGAETDQSEIGGIRFSSASNLDPLKQEQKTSLGQYVGAYLDTEGIDPASVVVDVARRAYVDQQSTSVELYVQGHDLHLDCDLDLVYGAWKVTGQTGAALKDELEKARKDAEDAKKAEEDAKKRLDEELQRQQQEAQAQEEA